MFTLTGNVVNQLRLLPAFSRFSADELQVAPIQTFDHSEVYRVRLPGEVRLIVKRAGAASGNDLALRERRFYEFVAPLLPDALVPKCHFSVDEPVGWLAIDDLSRTHRAAKNLASPSYRECLQLVQALASLHSASSLNDQVPRSFTTAMKTLPEAGIFDRVAVFERALNAFLQLISDRVNEQERQFLLGLSTLKDQIAGVPSLELTTLVHGDAHFSNFLYSENADACIIDWALPMLAFGEIDLAHALALNLPRRLRREWGAKLLEAYTERLRLLGCSVDRASVDQRYRLAVRYGFVNPVLWWVSGMAEDYWWPGFANILDAAREYGMIE